MIRREVSTRVLAGLCIALFGASTAFPVAAGILNTDAPPPGLGVADLMVGLLLFAASASVASRRRDRVTTNDRARAFVIFQMIVGIIPALLIVFFVLGDRIAWRVLVIGLAWRGWLLLYTLPYLVSAVR